MNSRNSNLDAAFLEQQRRRLLELRTQLQNAIRDGETEESEINGGSLPEAREAEEDAQRLAQLEVDGTLIGGS